MEALQDETFRPVLSAVMCVAKDSMTGTPSPATNFECTQKYLIAQLDGTSAVSAIKSLRPPAHMLTILGKFTLLLVKRVVKRKIERMHHL